MLDPLPADWNSGLAGQEEDALVEALLGGIDFSQLNQVFQSFLKVVGLPVAIIDLKAHVLASSNWQRVCMQFHRAHGVTLRRCVESDTVLAGQMQEGKPYAIYRCRNGLTDCAAPIVVEGRHVANLFIGQFFTAPPDLAFFKAQQEAMGFEEKAYFEAIAEVPIVAEEKLPAALELLTGLAGLIAAKSLAEYRARRAQAEVEAQVRERTEELREAQHIAKLGYWRLDLPDDRLFWSEEIYRIFEIDAQRFGASYEAFLAAIHPEDREKVNRAYAESVAGHGQYAIVHRLLMADGRVKYVEERGHTEYAADGTPLVSVGTVQDITAQEETRRALARTELAWTEALNQFNDAICILDKARRLVRGNRAFYAMVGGDAEHLAGRPIAEIVHPEGEAVSCPVCRAQEEGRDALIVLEADHPSNPAGLPVEVRVKVLRDAEGEAAGFLMSLHDLSHARRMQAALAESEARYRELIQGIHVAIVVHGADGSIVDFNRQALALLELSGDEARAAAPPRWRLLAADGSVMAAADDPASRVLRTGQPVRNLVCGIVRAGAGEPAWVLANADPVLDREGRLVQARVSYIDITERKRVEDELARYRRGLEDLVAERTRDLEASNRKLRYTEYAMERVGIGIAWNELETGRFLYANDEACRQLGYPREELLQLSVSDVNRDLRGEAVREIGRSMLATGDSLRLETVHWRKDGSSYPVAITAYIQHTEDQDWFIVFYHDITARKRAEAELRKAKEAAEAANRAKSVFLANMSHELRTPLNAILGFAQLMERDARIPEDGRANLGIINRSGKHLLGLINDVLEISRIEAGRLALHARPFDLQAMLLALEEMMRPPARNKGLALRLDLAPGLPRYLSSDEGKLRQVLLNLLSNAVKYTERGDIVLTAGAEVRGERADLRFEVRDTGVGIEAADLDKLFQAFYQADYGIRLGEGTGLGLAICREYARLLGGELAAESKPGEGSTFRFRLPAALAAAPAPETPSAGAVLGLASGQPAWRILVAEDQADNQRLIRELLARVGFQVRVAADGREAVAVFQAWRPHFVWMDMRMPEMDGYAATRAIRALPEGAQVPIVALTASAFEEDRAAILAAGCNDVLRKPIEADRLYAALGRYLDVAFEYAQIAAAGQEDGIPDLAALPQEERRRLLAAAQALDGDEARAVAGEIRLSRPEAAAYIERLAANYAFDALARAVEEAPEAGAAP